MVSYIIFDLGGGGLRFTYIPDISTIRIEENTLVADEIQHHHFGRIPSVQSVSQVPRLLRDSIRKVLGIELDEIGFIVVCRAGLDKMFDRKPRDFNKIKGLTLHSENKNKFAELCGLDRFLAEGRYVEVKDHIAHLQGSRVHSIMNGSSIDQSVTMLHRRLRNR